MKKYIKRPVVIEAVQWTGDNYDEIEQVVDVNTVLRELNGGCLLIGSSDGYRVAIKGDFIIKGNKGVFYIFDPDMFESTYIEVEG